MAQEPQVIGLACGSSHSLALLGKPSSSLMLPHGAAVLQPPLAAAVALRPASVTTPGAL
jgi:hypothetical protein